MAASPRPTTDSMARTSAHHPAKSTEKCIKFPYCLLSSIEIAQSTRRYCSPVVLSTIKMGFCGMCRPSPSTKATLSKIIIRIVLFVDVGGVVPMLMWCVWNPTAKYGRDRSQIVRASRLCWPINGWNFDWPNRKCVCRFQIPLPLNNQLFVRSRMNSTSIQREYRFAARKATGIRREIL